MIGLRAPRRIAAVAFLLPLLVPAPAVAFKIDTHVWIGQQVLNDLWPDCRVSIAPYGDFAVDPGVCAILKRHPAVYRMGTIGPDAFPDLVGGQMTAHPGLASGWKTDGWLRFMLQRAAGAAAGDREEAYAFAFGYVTHAASDIFAHSYVNSYAGDIFLLTDGEVEVELRHTALEDFIRRHMPPMLDEAGTVRLPQDVLSLPASFVRDAVILNPSVADQYGKDPSTLYLAGMYEYWAALDHLIDEAQALTDEVNAKIGDVNSAIGDLESYLTETIEICFPIVGCAEIPYCYFIDPVSCEITRASLEGLRASLALLQELNDLTVQGILLPFQLWKADVEEAIRQYVITSRLVAIEIMKPGGDPTGPLDEWVCNYASVFAAVPSVFNRPGCLARHYMDEIGDSISQFRSKVSSELGVLGWAVDPAQKVDELVEQEFKPRFENLVLDVIGSVSGQGSLMYSVAAMWLAEHDDASLDGEFAADSSSKSLLRIPDVSARVREEMHVDAGDAFDPERYAVVYDAIVMSKLVLLGPAELNRLVREAGVTDTAYGPDLYTPSDPFSVLLDAVQSIDGNQQWQETALPYPRRGPDPGWPDRRHYGRPFPDGLRIWQDCQAHRDVFLAIFRGPLVPGVEDPASIGFSGPDGFAPMFPPGPGNAFPLAGTLSTLVDLVAPRPVVDPLPTLEAECGVAITAPPATDNCASTVDVSTADATLYMTPGSYEVSWTFADHAANPWNGQAGNVATRTQRVDVRDTLPPSLDLVYRGPLCLWAPNHKWAVLRIGEELAGAVVDLCDPDAHLVIDGASSDQPADGGGDGHTSPDVVVWPDHVCLRSERAGSDRSGRAYTVNLAARDSSGNASETAITIRVAHDQSDHDCRKLDACLFVEDGDPLCLPPPPAALPFAGDGAVTRFGCSTGGAGAPSLALVLLFVLAHRRRRAARGTG